jgi:hypothetical protein
MKVSVFEGLLFENVEEKEGREESKRMKGGGGGGRREGQER